MKQRRKNRQDVFPLDDNRWVYLAFFEKAVPASGLSGFGRHLTEEGCEWVELELRDGCAAAIVRRS